MRKRIVLMVLLVLASAEIAAAQGNDSSSLTTSIAISHLQQPFRLDGRLHDWRGVAPLQLNSEKLVRGSEWGGSEDLSARVWLAWDDTRLYFATDRQDDDFQGCPPGSRPWEADAFLLSVRFPEGSQSETVFFIVVSEWEGKPKGMGLFGGADGYAQYPLPSMELSLGERPGMPPLIEGSVEWSDFPGLDKQPPERLELNLEFRDIDNGRKLKSITWVPGAGGAAAGSPQFCLAILLRPDELGGLIRQRERVNFTELVQLVILPVVVTDRSNNYVLDLDVEDFQITEDDSKQQISSLRFESRPMTVGLLIDNSGSMQNRIADAKDAAILFLESLREEDRCFVISFNHNIELIKDMEGGAEKAIEAIRNINAEGGTFLHSSIYYALTKLRYLREKKVLVLLTDGKDESQGGETPFEFPVSFDQILEDAIRQEAVVYAVGYRLRDSVALTELGLLTRETGGRIFTPAAADGLIEAYREIAKDLKSQYLITYISNNRNWDGRWRRIEVKVRGKDYQVRTRPGYYAPRR